MAILIDGLVHYLFDGKTHPLAGPMATWLASSRRFKTFVTTFRDKIRKKVRVTQEEESLYDLQLELETAFLLLQERSLNVMYEPQLGQVRCPDFAVTFTTSFTFMVEVTRLRAIHSQPPSDSPSLSPLVSGQLADTMCTKLGQLLPQRSNILIMGIDVPCPTPSDLNTAMLRLQQRAEQNDSMLFQQHGFQDRADFFRRYQRLSEVLVRRSELQADEPVVAWVNPQAKHPLPGKVRTVLYNSHSHKA